MYIIARWCYKVSNRLREFEDLVPEYIDPSNNYEFNYATFEKYKKENMQINVNADFIPALIGKGGENIKKLRKELGLSIDLGAKGSGAITLRGEEELIIKAKETLLNLAAKYEKENVITFFLITFNVFFFYHRPPD